MFARVLFQECKPGTVETLTHEAEESLIGPIREIPGFVSYRIVKLDDRSLIAIAVFATRAGAEEMNRIGAEWRAQYAQDAVVSVRPYVGEILLDVEPSRMEMHPHH